MPWTSENRHLYHHRFYRETMGRGRFQSITITEEESDLWIGWNLGKDSILMNSAPTSAPGGGSDGGHGIAPEIDPNRGHGGAELEAAVRSLAVEELHRVRSYILAYSTTHPEFLTSFDPLPVDPAAPPVVISMLMAGLAAGVGPMAAVAGAVAGAVATALGNALQNKFDFAELVIENGGDYWISVREPLPVQVYAGLSSLSGKVSVIVPPELSPCGLACSSGTVGPSISFGKADAALVIAKNTAAADAWATALGNRLHSQNDLAPAVEELINTDYTDIGEEYRPLGALAIMADKLAACGCIRLG